MPFCLPPNLSLPFALLWISISSRSDLSKGHPPVVPHTLLRLSSHVTITFDFTTEKVTLVRQDLPLCHYFSTHCLNTQAYSSLVLQYKLLEETLIFYPELPRLEADSLSDCPDPSSLFPFCLPSKQRIPLPDPLVRKMFSGRFASCNYSIIHIPAVERDSRA